MSEENLPKKDWLTHGSRKLKQNFIYAALLTLGTGVILWLLIKITPDPSVLVNVITPIYYGWVGSILALAGVYTWANFNQKKIGAEGPLHVGK